MVPLAALWLPILLSAVLAFLVSSVIHMALPWHAKDYAAVPDEEALRRAVLPLNIPAGDYIVPRPGSAKELRDPAFQARRQEGPNIVMTVLPKGGNSMGRSLGLWFVYLVVVAIFAAYVAGRALGPGAAYPQVFRFVGVTAFLALAVGLWQMSIWWSRRWWTTFTTTVDGLVYALVMAGTFGWLWPR